jgi:hypothetical protein
MSKHLTTPDSLLSLLHKLQDQRDELKNSLGDFQLKRKMIQSEFKDLETQIEVLDCINDCISDLKDRISERAEY